MQDLTDMQAQWLLTAEPGTWELRPTLGFLGQECAALGLVEPAGAENAWRLTAAGQDAWRRLSDDPPPDPHRVRADQDDGPAFLPPPRAPGAAARPAAAVSPLDILRSAKTLVDQHGAGAGAQAVRRIDELDAAGDEAGRRVWQEILRAIDELRRAAPRRGEARH